MIYSSSLACANLLNLESDVGELIRAGHRVMHIDIMDGHYVPNLCLNLDIVQALKKKFNCVIDAHLMVEDPFLYVEKCAAAGVDYFSFHLDGTRYPYKLAREIKEVGMKVGVVLSPKDTVEEIGELIQLVDLCLVMSVEPGFSGQQFMDLAYEKIDQLHKIKEAQNLDYLISVDGGINADNGKKCKELGATMLVMGVFSFFNQGIPISEACERYVKAIEA